MGVFASDVFGVGQLGAADMAFDASGDLLITGGGGILKLDGQTGTPTGFEIAGYGGQSVEIGPDGDIYLNHRTPENDNGAPTGEILRFDGQSGDLVSTLATPNNSHAWGLAFDSAANLYAAIYEPPGSIARYAPNSSGVFNLSLSSPSGVPVTVDFNTADITATSGSDYVATSGTLVFAPGVTSRTIIVPTIDDLVQESDETFEVTLSNAVGASITDAQGIGTILDDGDPANQPPTAEAGGPYAVGQGGSVTLHGSGSDPDQDAGLLDYLWDLDGDGLFGEVGAGAVQGDEVGPTPTFHAANLPGESAHDIALRVIDLGGLEAEDTAVVDIQGLHVELGGVVESYSYQSYANQDVAPTVAAVEDGGDTLRLVGNTWKRLQLPHTVTANTVLEFDFESNVEGEVHAVGLDTNNSLNTADAFFQLGGTQSWWAYQDFNNYATGSGVKHYVIPVGQYFTGSSSNLVFANDDDASAVAESLFSNIRIYERA